MSTGSLVVVGTGIKWVSHVTLETQSLIQDAEKVFVLLSHATMMEWVYGLNPTVESLHPFYVPGKLRRQTYQEITEHILTAVRQGKRVCAVFSGHPGIFVTSAHQAIRQARREGFKAWMAPGISAEACLFADLGIDPATHGCQSVEATAFLLQQQAVNVTMHLILWQIGIIGELAYANEERAIQRGLQLLTEVLQVHYGRSHTITLYQASELPTFAPTVIHIPIAQLPTTPITPMATLYVPPLNRAPFNPDIMARLGIQPADVGQEEGHIANG